MNIIDRISTYFRTRRHAKGLKKIHDGLLSNPQLLLETQQKYEAQFGKDIESRNARQWANLVRVYGMDQVCEIEGMTPDEVSNRCVETFSQSAKRKLNRNK